MPVSAEAVEIYEARFEAFLAANPQIAALDDDAIMCAMPPIDAVSSRAEPLNSELPY